MGLTTNDASLSVLDFSGSKFAGLNGTAPIEVMYNNGPAAAEIVGVGLARVAYEIEISDLQEAGDYSTTLTYICTPQF
jgi:hypothetical protein